MVEIGDKLLVTGGYDYHPQWLEDREGCVGTVVKFLPEGKDRKRKLVLDLGKEFRSCGFCGRYLILFLRYKNAKWEDEGVVHVVVGNTVPESAESIGAAADPEKGFKWVEAAATYRVVERTPRPARIMPRQHSTIG